jgi:hypothetical protein
VTPHLIMSVECYHVPDAQNGQGGMCVTHTAKATVEFESCFDMTKDVDLSRSHHTHTVPSTGM